MFQSIKKNYSEKVEDKASGLFQLRTIPRIIYTLALWFGVAFFVIAAIISPQKVREVGSKMSYLGQVSEWELQPYVEIKLEEYGCDVGWNPVFSKLWSGLEYSCLSYENPRSDKCVKSIGPEPPI